MDRNFEGTDCGLDLPGYELTNAAAGWQELADAVTSDQDDNEADIDDDLPSPEAIAGITVVDVSDKVPFSRQESYAYHLALEHTAAAGNFGRWKFAPNLPRGQMDPRIAHLEVWDNPRDGLPNRASPHYSFMLGDSLMKDVLEATVAKNDELTSNELLHLALENTESAVNPDFSPGALNNINASYFGSEVAFSPQAGLATVFATNRVLNYALGSLLAKESGATGTMRIKELCSGSRTQHWNFESAGVLNTGLRRVEVTLSDFVTPDIDPHIESPNVSVRAEQYSLFDEMPELPGNERYDAVVTTYGFDSVWQDEDIRLVKVGDQWYQTMYRVKVADWNLRRNELIEALRDGAPLPNAKPHEYDGIFVETAMQPIDLSEHPYARYIEEHDQTTINVPGGLIKRVLNAFESQLKDDGVFVSCDVANFGFGDDQSPRVSSSVSGVAARYRGDDYVLAKKILEEEYGFEVRLASLEEVVSQNVPGNWRAVTNASERRSIEDGDKNDNGAMIIRRRRNR